MFQPKSKSLFGFNNGHKDEGEDDEKPKAMSSLGEEEVENLSSFFRPLPQSTQVSLMDVMSNLGESAPKLASKDAKRDDVKLATAKDPPPSNDDDNEKPPSAPPADQLKPGWTEHNDPAANAPYWTNDKTGESTWHKP
eukprot:CAMPEP_0182458770 /NCGR_PEP_ID=MMETSP1319-20130603/4036_1 /TAXON_ID=172717 /ORGANISM="Bolidomonas pacifica, Strain RCC208" /LENGTH=137 /DNA_ID=CAMNT_0024657517 /DNA_START=118 /DNA_END=531 /DNA_ORIENTATION=-